MNSINFDLRQDESGLLRKISDVIARIPHIEKRGVNKHFGYNYFLIEDILNALSPILCDIGITILHHVVKVDFSVGNGIVAVYTSHSICDVDTNEIITMRFCGTAKDEKKSASNEVGDKAFFKALTTANRYFYQQTFRIGIDNFDDADSDGETVAPEKAHGRFRQFHV